MRLLILASRQVGVRVARRAFLACRTIIRKFEARRQKSQTLHSIMSTSTAVRPTLMRILQSPKVSHLPPTFLVPCFQNLTQISPFSTSPTNSFPRDHNRERGVSTIRRTGPKQRLSLSDEPLPVPVLDPARRSKVAVDEDHGLWQFFHSKDKPMNTPEEDSAHGRPWCVEELRGKSWEDLHSLWYECCKERNRIATEAKERERVSAGYGNAESQKRDRAVSSRIIGPFTIIIADLLKLPVTRFE